MPRISLCMIARDEEVFLPECLRSVRHAVQQIVLVDTGSQDRTMEIARKAGAVVLERPWDGDFAAARNLSLTVATGDWILVLDADERLAPGGARALKKAVERTDLDCGMLPLYNATRVDASAEDVLSGRARVAEPVLLPRLLRRTDDLAWEGLVHESVGLWVTRGRRKLGRVDAPLIHLGSVPEVWEARRKGDRNLSLLRRRVKEEPEAIQAWGYLAAELLRRGDTQEAREVVEQGWAEFIRCADSLPFRPAIGPLAQTRVAMKIDAGDFEEAQATAVLARAYGVHHPNLDWCEARSYVVKASIARQPDVRELERAVALLKSCLAARGQMFNEEIAPGVYGLASHQLCGDALLMLGQPEAAIDHFEQVLAEAPDHLGGRLGIAEALLDLGEARAALLGVQEILPGGGADAWALAAAAAAGVGATADARLFSRQAMAARGGGMLVPRRLLRLEGLR